MRLCAKTALRWKSLDVHVLMKGFRTLLPKQMNFAVLADLPTLPRGLVLGPVGGKNNQKTTLLQ